MSIRINEAGFRFFTSELGPIGRDLRRRAENITAAAEVNASGLEIGIESGALHSGIRYEIREGPEGLEAIIGTDANKDGFSYPAWHDQNGRPWLTNALRDALSV
jgi:hypothetical protein